jgi:acetyl esterase/lipase
MISGSRGARRGRRHTARTRAAGLLLALAVTVTACSGGSTSDAGKDSANDPTSTSGPTAGERGPRAGKPEMLAADDPGFYDVPRPLPRGRHGDLLRVQPVAGAPTGVRWLRIMYLSETLAGKPTVVTGVVTLPDAEPPPGGWPLFAHAHGSTGLADACAPSVSLTGDRTSAPEIVLLTGEVARRSIAVVSTDYEGLGGPGRHPFLVGESEGRSVLDSVRAVRGLPDTELSADVGIIGYSQGGHAAAWANQLAGSWTPELDVVGVLAGAPATEVTDMVSGDDRASLLLAAGLAATGDDEFDIARVLTPAGTRALDVIDRVCQQSYPTDGPFVQVDLLQTEPWKSALAATVPGSSPGAAPVLIVHSQEDRNVPVDDSATFQARLCRAGGTVERRVLPTGDHVLAAIPAYQQAIDWITELRSGEQPTSTCP